MNLSLNGLGEPTENIEMNLMTLSFLEFGLRSSTLPPGYRGFPEYLIYRSERGKSFYFFKTGNDNISDNTNITFSG